MSDNMSSGKSPNAHNIKKPVGDCSRMITAEGSPEPPDQVFMLDDLPEPPDQVFMLATPAHVLTKLHWEIYSLRKALSEKPEHIGHIHAPAYCAFNCAVTAWHLADWVWNASPKDRRTDFLVLLGATVTDNDHKDFVNFQTAIRNQSRALHICRQLATGSKHMAVTTHPDPNLRAEMRWECAPLREQEMPASDPFAVDRYRLVVSDKGIERAAVDVFENAFKDWERFLGRWGFIEGRCPPAGRRPLHRGD
jgi:hypothetical protein